MHRRGLPLKILGLGALCVAAILAALGFASTPKKEQSVSLTIVGLDSGRRGPHTVLRLTNAGPSSIYYEGYGAQDPWYSYRFKTPAGLTNYCPFWCGTGLRECALLPGQSADFAAPTLTNSDYQIVLGYAFLSPMQKVLANAPGWLKSHFDTPQPRYVATQPINTKPKQPAAERSTDR